MQEKTAPVANTVRTERTIAALKAAAGELFREVGYAATSTQQIVKRAKVTRGALYHHFEDKRALFEAIIADELSLVATAINQDGRKVSGALAALKNGGRAFIREFARNDRTQLILIEAPAVLGREKIIEMEDMTTRHTLTLGLKAAMQSKEMQTLPLQATVELFSAAFDAASLHIESGHSLEDMTTVLDALIDGLATPD